MEKSAIGSVAWCASTEGYQLREQIDQGIVATSVNDESAAWNAWLEREPSFAFQGRDGCHLTVLKEKRGQGRAYWTAYRSVGGKLKRKYLGASTKITLARLEEAATALSEGTAASGISPHPRRSISALPATFAGPWRSCKPSLRPISSPCSPYSSIDLPRPRRPGCCSWTTIT